MLQTSIFPKIVFIFILLLFLHKSHGSSINDVIFGANGANAECINLKNNYQFDFTFNQLVKGDQSPNVYNHYIVSDGRFFKLNIPYSTSSSSLLHPSIAKSSSQSTKHHKDPEAPFLERIELAAKSDFKALKYDLGFSFQAPTEKDPKMTQFCALKLETFVLNCVKMHHFSGRNFGDAQAFAEMTFVKMRLEVDFLPSVAFQPIEYTDFANTRYVVQFIEQKLVQNSSTRKWTLSRRFQAYNFKNVDNIGNQTRYAVLPNYYKGLPIDLEITGIFSWKNGGDYRYLITVFNGTNHLYCYDKCTPNPKITICDNTCHQKTGYKTFLEHCKPYLTKISTDGRPLLLIDQVAKMASVPEREEVLSQETVMERQKDLRETIAFIWRMTIYASGITIAILTISILYYFVKESLINQERFDQMEQAALEGKPSMETLSSHGSSCSPLLMNKVTAGEQHPL